MTDDKCDPDNHDWIPFGFRVYSTDGLGNPEFLRTEDVRCLKCGDVRQVRGDNSIQSAWEQLRSKIIG